MANLCEHYPCHEPRPSDFTCELCYCPEYGKKECSGTPKFVVLSNGIDKIKDCTDCVVNHTTEYVTKHYKSLKDEMQMD